MAKDKEKNKKNLFAEPGNSYEKSMSESPASAEERNAHIDQKITELEERLEEVKKLKESTELASDKEEKEREQIASANQQYRQIESKKNKVASRKPFEATKLHEEPGPMQLLELEAKKAVATLVAMAKKNTAGFEKAISLIKRIADKPGGAWILDQFHLEITKDKTK